MRYLWVEDFNGNGDFVVQQNYKDIWIPYFQLEEADIVFKTTFTTALEYIHKNPNGFDLVLLDMHLFAGNLRPSIPPKEEYMTYFSDFKTKEYYDKHVLDTAGKLICLYLIEKIKFPRERIAFISAYVPQEEVVKGKSKSEVGFHQLNQEFEEIGMIPPVKFLKPMSATTEVDPLFQSEFVKNITSDYLDFRRNAISFASITRENIRILENKETKREYLEPFHKLLTCIDEEKKELDLCTVKDCNMVLDKIMVSEMNGYPDLAIPEGFSTDCNNIATLIRNSGMLSLCESLPNASALNRRFKNNPFQKASLTTLKIFRNWDAHTNILKQNFTLQEATFLLVIYFYTSYAYESPYCAKKQLKEINQLLDQILGTAILPEDYKKQAKQQLFRLNQKVTKEVQESGVDISSDVLKYFQNFSTAKDKFHLKSTLLCKMSCKELIQQFFFFFGEFKNNTATKISQETAMITDFSLDFSGIDSLSPDSLEKRIVALAFSLGFAPDTE